MFKRVCTLQVHSEWKLRVVKDIEISHTSTQNDISNDIEDLTRSVQPPRRAPKMLDRADRGREPPQPPRISPSTYAPYQFSPSSISRLNFGSVERKGEISVCCSCF
ncbi:uncharacterized protein LOC113463866 [Ceratina calcarata]|uniref:Uncharacterized protein LOC113463866 n=1 Tax=Ceratina calcarata TaxID=156304 RepID=A0AAJ7RWN0_9HYME|nr:uncharacterized protein LOC113463866 [Ceratina calcarata]